jgi:hypothetical protein
MHSVYFKEWEGGGKDGLCQLTGPPCEVQYFSRGLRFSLISENNEMTVHGVWNPLKPAQNSATACLSIYSSNQINY